MRLSNIVILLISLVLSLSVAELTVRLLYPELSDAHFNPYYNVDPRWNMPDEELGFIRRPFIKWQGWAYNDPAAHFVHFNTDENGFRNPPYQASAEIIFIGDSFTEAGNVPEEYSFVRLVAEQLNTTTLNLGRIGYGPPHYLKVMQRYAANYSPRIIVWVIFEGNDLLDAENFYHRRLLTPVELKQQRDSGVLGVLNQSFVFRLIKQIGKNFESKIAWQLQGNFATTNGKTELIDFHYKYHQSSSVTQLTQGWHETQSSIQQAQLWAEQESIELMFVFVPIKIRVMGPYTDFSQADTKVLSDFVPGQKKWQQKSEFARALESLCQNLGCRFFDITKLLQQSAAKGELVYSARYDTHLDTAGHKLLARFLIAAITRK